MDVKSLIVLASKYTGVLKSNGAVARRAEIDRCFEPATDRHLLLNHAMWQLMMVRHATDCVGGTSTALQLLGSAQGILLATGLITVNEIWSENRKWLDTASARAFDELIARVGTNPTADNPSVSRPTSTSAV